VKRREKIVEWAIDRWYVDDAGTTAVAPDSETRNPNELSQIQNRISPIIVIYRSGQAMLAKDGD